MAQIDRSTLYDYDTVRGLVTGTSLNLSDRGLTALPEAVLELSTLQSLSVSDNQLTVIPDGIGRLVNLERLYLNGNQIEQLPEALFTLTKLRILNVSTNRLAALPPQIGALSELESLSLGNNLLTSLPVQLEALRNLQGLGVSRNRLESLPASIGRMVGLRRLYAAHNALATIPADIADALDRGLRLDLDGNPLGEPIPELLGRGTEALVSYLRSLDDAVSNYEAKVLLVGEGNVGKTSLVAALRNEKFVEKRPTTHGIEIHPLLLPHPQLDIDMTIRAWDFGGQEVYRITHQFFFSNRALYLVVWNTREGQEQNEVEGWIRRVRLRVGDAAPVIIVATHSLERRPELDYPQLNLTFPKMLRGYYAVDNLNGTGIGYLAKAIAQEASKLPQMGQLISSRWLAVRDHLLELKAQNPYIAYEHYENVCLQSGVAEKEILVLAELLHDLGQIIYYGDVDGLRDIVVLNPEWLTKAIGYVLEDSTTRDHGGLLDHSRLASVWGLTSEGQPLYPTKYHRYFLRLMEKFDVSYRLHEDENRSLVAQLVPHERPALPWSIETPVANNVRSLAMICQLSEPAPGLIAWLTVRHHRATIGSHWRKGVFLRHPIATYASQALIELRSPRELMIEVRAPSPDLYFHVIRDSVEDLLQRRWPGLDYTMLVPCPTRHSNGSWCDGRFPLIGTMNLREQGLTDAPCFHCSSVHDLSQLVTGFGSQDSRIVPELEKMQDQMASMRTGVERLQLYASDTADVVRRVIRIVGTEVDNCPRLFTLAPMSRSAVLNWFSGTYRDRFQLTLWCEQPGEWHPWPEASYEIQPPKEWVTTIGPYAAVVLKALRLLTPIAGAVGGVAVPGEAFSDAQKQLDLMKTLLDRIPTIPVEDELAEELRPGKHPQLTLAEGEALRALRSYLFDVDKHRSFGGLRRTPAISGELIWVCPQHYRDYDRGLPHIPAPSAIGRSRVPRSRIGGDTVEMNTGQGRLGDRDEL